MKQKFFTNLVTGLPSAIAIIILLVFAGLKQADNKKPPSTEAQCCFGYQIGMNQVRQFMLDSLKSGSFEGGIYSKADLLKAINKVNGDSLYLMHALLNCLL